MWPAGERVGVILQARMGSTRLPGKVMRTIGDRPMIEWVVERLRQIPGIDGVVLATSTHPQEAPLVDWAKTAGAAMGVTLFRGDEQDVLDRYLRCMEAYGFDAVVRATGDNPYVCPIEGGRLVDLFRRTRVDYASSLNSDGSGLPVGVGLEVIAAEALRVSAREGTAAHHREHVNEYILEHPGRFRRRVCFARPEHRAPDLSLTVDTPDHLAAVRRLHAEHQQTRRGPIRTAWLVERHLAGPAAVRRGAA